MTATPRSLFTIPPRLTELVDRLEACPSDDRAALELNEYVSFLTLENPDAIAAYIALYEDRAEAKEAEENIAKRRAMKFQVAASDDRFRADQISRIALEALKNAGKGKIEGEQATLVRQKVGGVLTLNAHSPGIIPDRFKHFKLDLTWNAFREMGDALRETDKGKTLLAYFVTAKSEVQNDVLRDALESGAEIAGARLELRKEKLVIK